MMGMQQGHSSPHPTGGGQAMSLGSLTRFIGDTLPFGRKSKLARIQDLLHKAKARREQLLDQTNETMRKLVLTRGKLLAHPQHTRHRLELEEQTRQLEAITREITALQDSIARLST